MKVLSYEVHNVLRLSDAAINLEGRHLFLVGGKNAQGKTSALTALLMALCGRSGMDYPTVALKKGEDRGTVKVELAGEGDEPAKLTVELTIKRQRGGNVVEEFKILDADGKETAEPRSLLKRLYEMRAFDPLAFERMERKAKKELLQKLLGLDLTVEKAEYQKLFDERAGVNRDGKALKARFDAMPKFPDAPKQEVSAAELVAELNVRKARNKANGEKRDELAEVNLDLTKAENKVMDLDAKMSDLMEQIRTAKEGHASLVKQKSVLDQVCTALVDQDEQEVLKRIESSDAINTQVRANVARAEADKKLTALRSESSRLDEKLETNLKRQQDRLKSAKWPIPELSLDDEGVLLNGLPFEQASRKEQVLASVAIGMALNPKLKLLVSQDGGVLDTDAMEALDGILAKNGFTMIVELVTRTLADESLCAVIFRDGQAETPAPDTELE